MVCTTAFGIGVDVPNIDLVIKIGCPLSLEELIQEFGRGGRDGRLAKGYLLFADDDLQHAAYWCKDKSTEERVTILAKYQEVWKYVYSYS
jgi:ATP-dependent DNA helicase RecQ